MSVKKIIIMQPLNSVRQKDYNHAKFERSSNGAWEKANVKFLLWGNRPIISFEYVQLSKKIIWSTWHN